MPVARECHRGCAEDFRHQPTFDPRRSSRANPSIALPSLSMSLTPIVSIITFKQSECFALYITVASIHHVTYRCDSKLFRMVPFARNVARYVYLTRCAWFRIISVPRYALFLFSLLAGLNTNALAAKGAVQDTLIEHARAQEELLQSTNEDIRASIEKDMDQRFGRVNDEVRRALQKVFRHLRKLCTSTLPLPDLLSKFWR